MKKTLTVNLANQVFHIDEDAYVQLKEYLEKIEGHFSSGEDRNDIIGDIENRIAELFGEKITHDKQVITIQDVEQVITTMGDPVEIGGDTKSESQAYTSHSRPRRLYRDPDNRVLGGVCGGIGMYTGTDPIITRIIFLIAFFGFGVGLLIYIIMWIVVPEAVTTAQKLEMRGDPVNASNIGKFIRDEFDSVKKNFQGKQKEKI